MKMLKEISMINGKEMVAAQFVAQMQIQFQSQYAIKLFIFIFFVRKELLS